MAVDSRDIKPPRRWGWRILLTLCSLALLTWAAPMIAAWTPVVTWMCAPAKNYFDGSIRVGGASLGWFSPIVLYGVELRDRDDQPFAYIMRVESDRTLLDLLFAGDDLGVFRVHKPSVEFSFGKKDSTFEKVFAKTLQRPATTGGSGTTEKAATFPRLRVEIIDANVKLHDTVLGETWKMGAIAVNIFTANDESRTVTISAQGTTHDGTEAGIFKADLLLEHLSQPNAKATINGRITSFPVMLANVALRRYYPDALIMGSLQAVGTITATMNNGKPIVHVSGELIATEVTLTDPGLPDPVYFERFQAPCTARLEDRKLIVERAELVSELGTARLHGSLDFGADWLAFFEQADFDLALDFNLAFLLERLPNVLHVHPDLRLKKGQVVARCKSQRRNGAIVWDGHLHTSDVRGLKGEQEVAWKEPIALDFEVRNLHTGLPLFEKLKCTAKFLHVESSQTADGFKLTAEADLQQLAEPLGQFIDVAGLKPGGQVKASLQFRHVDPDIFVAIGDAQFKNVNLAWLTKNSWQEETASVKLEARGHVGKNGRTSIEAADVKVNLGSDHLNVKTAAPIADLLAGPWGSLTVHIDGDLARWHHRLRGWTTLLDDWQLAGQADLQLQIQASPQEIVCTSANLLAINFRCVGPNLWIQEPALNLQTSARWRAKTGAVEFTHLKLACPTLQANAALVSVQIAPLRFQGSTKIVADVARLRKWRHNPKTEPVESMHGTLVGRVDFNATAAVTHADFELSWQDFSYGKKAAPTWREPDVKCVGRGAYDPAKDLFHVEKISLAAEGLNADIKGTFANLATTCDLDLNGNLTYDLEKMEPKLRPLLGKDVKIVGKDARTFKLAGALHPRPQSSDVSAPAQLRLTALKGDASLSWKSLKTQGCDVGAAEIKAVVQEGWLQLYPIETTFNGGTLRIQPNVRLEPEPMELILLAGPMLEKAKVTPALCAGALGYAMPMLANAAEADGSISLTLESGRLPLSAPTRGDLKGTLVVHEAKIGANPVVRQLSALLKIPAGTGVMKNCTIPFRMVDGKVYHSNLELTFGDMTLRSSGAVGMDGSLALVIDMPIPARLAGKLIPGRAKQMIRIPISGTIEHPRLDSQALESLAAAVGRPLLEKELKSLLQPLR